MIVDKKIQMILLKTLFDFKGLFELKMVHQKTKTDPLVGLEGLWVIIMYFNAYILFYHANNQKSGYSNG